MLVTCSLSCTGNTNKSYKSYTAIQSCATRTKLSFSHLFIFQTSSSSTFSALRSLIKQLSLLPFLSSLWYSPSRWAEGEWIFTIPILEKRLENWFKPKGFVNKSANWQWVVTWISLITFAKTLSLNTWQSISICFVLSWNTGFNAV